MEICRELLEQVRRSLSLDPHPTVEARRSALVCGCFKGDTRRCYSAAAARAAPAAHVAPGAARTQAAEASSAARWNPQDMI